MIEEKKRRKAGGAKRKFKYRKDGSDDVNTITASSSDSRGNTRTYY